MFLLLLPGHRIHTRCLLLELLLKYCELLLCMAPIFRPSRVLVMGICCCCSTSNCCKVANRANTHTHTSRVCVMMK